MILLATISPFLKLHENNTTHFPSFQIYFAERKYKFRQKQKAGNEKILFLYSMHFVTSFRAIVPILSNFWFIYIASLVKMFSISIDIGAAIDNAK